MLSAASKPIKAVAESAVRAGLAVSSHETAANPAHVSTGMAERAILELARQVRTLASAFESHCKKRVACRGLYIMRDGLSRAFL